MGFSHGSSKSSSTFAIACVLYVSLVTCNVISCDDEMESLGGGLANLKV